MRIYSFAKLSVRPFPTLFEINHPYIFGGVQTVINVSETSYPKEILDAFQSRGIRWYHFPMSEDVIDVDILLAAVRQLILSDQSGDKILLHCQWGNNRSRTVAEAFYYVKMGTHFDDEYKKYPNHLIYNCSEGHLLNLEEVERRLSLLRK